MYKYLTKNGQLIAFGVGLLVTLIFLGVVFSGLEDFMNLPLKPNDANPDATLRNQSDLFNFGLYAAIALAIICAVGMLAFGIYHVATNFQSSLKGIIGLAVILIIFVIAYYSTGEATGISAAALKKMQLAQDGWQNQFISGGMITGLVLCAVAFGSFVVSEIINFFK